MTPAPVLYARRVMPQSPAPLRTTHSAPLLALVPMCAAMLLSAACGPEGAPATQRTILQEDIPRIKEMLEQDRHKHRAGIREAARMLRRGFLVEDSETRERQMRVALRRIQQPAARGSVSQFISSPMSFLAAIDTDGVVIARDSENDQMRGLPFGERYPTVAAALSEGTEGREIGEFPSLEEGEPPSYSILFTAPVVNRGERVGAVVAGIPLWREAQRLSNQMRIDHASEIQDGLIVWVYVYKADRVFYGPDTPPEVNDIVPDHAARTAGLAASPGGFTGDLQLHGRWYGYAVVPVPSLGEDIGVVMMRSDPQ